jgi:hypothetical protein
MAKIPLYRLVTDRKQAAKNAFQYGAGVAMAWSSVERLVIRHNTSKAQRTIIKAQADGRGTYCH